MTTLMDSPLTGNDEELVDPIPGDGGVGVPTTDDKVTIELDAVGLLSYAFAHNRMPVIPRLEDSLPVCLRVAPSVTVATITEFTEVPAAEQYRLGPMPRSIS
jgi:hypothetical protein